MRSCNGVSPSSRLADFPTLGKNCQTSPSKELCSRCLVPSQVLCASAHQCLGLNVLSASDPRCLSALSALGAPVLHSLSALVLWLPWCLEALSPQRFDTFNTSKLRASVPLVPWCSIASVHQCFGILEDSTPWSFDVFCTLTFHAAVSSVPSVPSTLVPQSFNASTPSVPQCLDASEGEEYLSTKVNGTGLDSEDYPEVKYAVLGAGIGAIFALCFVAIKLYMIKKHMLDNELSEICEALNVTVSPGPVAMFMEGENVTLSCHVSQQKNSNSILVVRWMFSLVPDEEHLLVKMNMRKTSKRKPPPGSPVIKVTIWIHVQRDSLRQFRVFNSQANAFCSRETVTSVISSSPGQKRKEKKHKKKKTKANDDVPPEIPVKGTFFTFFLAEHPQDHKLDFVQHRGKN
ncbi:UNVERIFIED_CONTAM: hypothetical protein FKN15_021263 [Acipenser sinensis]